MRATVRVTRVAQLLVTVAVMMSMVAVRHTAYLQRDAHAEESGRKEGEISQTVESVEDRAHLHDIHHNTDGRGNQHDRRIDIVLPTDQTLYGH